MKIGIDIHGVSDTKKQFFAKFTERVIANGHTVYIITGSMRTNKIEEELASYGIKYHYFLSVADKLLSENKIAKWSDEENPWFSDEDWNQCKAELCKEKGIDVHFDDSEVYGKYFTSTVYVKVI